MLKRALLSISAMAAVAGCQNSTGSELDQPMDAAEWRAFHAGQARWNSSRPAHYRVEFARGCYCHPQTNEPISIEVRDGLIASASYVRPAADTIADYQGRELNPMTVDDVFARLLEASRDDIVRDMTIEYDPVHGYPTYAVVLLKAVDGDWSLSLSNLTPLP